MENIKVFENPEFGKVRTALINGEPWFVGNDIAAALGYGSGKSLPNAIARHVDDEDKGVTEMMTPGGAQNMTIINESGLYSLVLSSKLPGAKKFKRWVTSEVLPAIRKTGAYDIHQDSYMIADPVERAKKWIEEETVRKEQAKAIERMKPKEIFSDAVAGSGEGILIGALAKLIQQNGYPIGQKRLFRWLRDNGYLIKQKGSDYNTPTQRAMELGLFKVKERTIVNPDGSVRLTRTTLVTGKGQIYFVNKFMKLKAAEDKAQEAV
jgi:anti-repressor protein